MKDIWHEPGEKPTRAGQLFFLCGGFLTGQLFADKASALLYDQSPWCYESDLVAMLHEMRAKILVQSEPEIIDRLRANFTQEVERLDRFRRAGGQVGPNDIVELTYKVLAGESQQPDPQILPCDKCEKPASLEEGYLSGGGRARYYRIRCQEACDGGSSDWYSSKFNCIRVWNRRFRYEKAATNAQTDEDVRMWKLGHNVACVECGFDGTMLASDAACKSWWVTCGTGICAETSKHKTQADAWKEWIEMNQPKVQPSVAFDTELEQVRKVGMYTPCKICGKDVDIFSGAFGKNWQVYCVRGNCHQCTGKHEKQIDAWKEWIKENQPKALPCRKCGNLPSTSTLAGKGFWLSCDTCQQAGPTFDTANEATEEWNKRMSQPKTEPAITRKIVERHTLSEWREIFRQSGELEEIMKEKDKATPEPQSALDLNAILDTRQVTNGNLYEHGKISQALKLIMRDPDRWGRLSPGQQESLEMIAHKIARILAGNPKNLDHWVDIAGYATLIANGLREEAKS